MLCYAVLGGARVKRRSVMPSALAASKEKAIDKMQFNLKHYAGQVTHAPWGVGRVRLCARHAPASIISHSHPLIQHAPCTMRRSSSHTPLHPPPSPTLHPQVMYTAENWIDKNRGFLQPELAFLIA